MPKRSRGVEQVKVVPPSLSSLPYSTVEGGKWLKKALDPVDTMTEVAGLPDINTNQRAVLNYQMQDDIPIPKSETFNANLVQSYDADLYLYQDPIIYGMSTSYPQSTKNPGEFPITIDIKATNADISANTLAYECVVKFAPGTAPRTCNVFYNNQIEGDTTSEKLKNLQKYCQRSRLSYGGIQAIPACSALFDSGTIEATQQIFSPENKMVTNLNVTGYSNTPYSCQVFKKDDFPDEGSSIQNATSLYCRYKEGLYMPYKLVNPLVYPYTGSEEKCLIESPFIVTGIYPRMAWYRYLPLSNNPNDPAFYTDFSDFTYDSETSSYKSEITFTNVQKVPYGVTLYLECVSKLGQKFYFAVTPDVQELETSHSIGAKFSLELPSSIGAYPHQTSNFINMTNTVKYSENTPILKCVAVTQAPFGDDSINTVSFMLPRNNSNIGIVCFRSIGLQASIRLIFRIGIEMMIVAGGVYSPFKHKSPSYDQRALNTYVRACHCMRDAFLGNAASSDGHNDYAAHIAEIVAAEYTNNVSNLGSNWYGRVSV